ncbi:MAG TPA: HupE/UreJ family protein [Chitinophagaceae bacterium]|jgi:hydrogenase/urease accessory protein HupE|nr:HupE/UreJ family protein [Chitinophagaceae bacterium]
MKKVLCIISLFIFLGSYAHEIRPAYLEIKENADHSLSITWKQPLMGEYGIPLHPVISAGWLPDSTAEKSYAESYLVKHWEIPPGHAALDAQTITIYGLEKTITDVLVQVILPQNSFTYLVKPIHPLVTLNIEKPQPPPVWQYIQLGIYHIWTGFDHLLFVFGLLLLVRKRSLLIWTITAFTIAHSITLALATMHIVKVSSAFTEAAIALSIVFLGIELVHHYQGKNGLAFKFPWLVSFVFGLLHGLGFASALSDVGLPQHNIPMALFLFNVGVELGQLSFVMLVLLVIALIKLTRYQVPKWTLRIPAYILGTLAMYWFIERVLAM